MPFLFDTDPSSTAAQAAWIEDQSHMRFLLGDTTRGPMAFTLPVNPEEIKVGRAATTINFNVEELGSLIFPTGTAPRTVAWDGFFPGLRRKNQFFFNEGPNPPSNWHRVFEAWLNERARVSLLVTGTVINIPAMYLERFDYTIKGGYGDIWYTCSFVEARALIVPVDGWVGTTPEPVPATASVLTGANTTKDVEIPTTTEKNEQLGEKIAQVAAEDTTNPTVAREDPGPPRTYIVLPGDTLIRISCKQYGHDGRWRDIYERNKELIGANPNLINIGIELILP